MFAGLFVPALLALFSVLSGTAPSDEVGRAVARVMPEVVASRRDIHAHPELGERETRTAGLVARRLKELGLEVREGVAVTGVVGILKGGRPGRVVAYRADMDALPVREETGLPYASERTDTWDGGEVGVMHACGHDMHTAIALGVAATLADPAVRAGWAGTVVFLFQPAEEGMPDSGRHGAELMVAEGALRDPAPEAVFGLHVNPVLQVGQISLVPGGALAAVDRFRIRVVGQQTHGAYPQAGVDPIVAASQIVMGLQTIVARNVDTRSSAVVTVGKFQAGNRFNIIPGEAELLGTVRTHEDSVRQLVLERIETIAKSTAEALGARAEVEIETITPVTFNDPELAARMRPSLLAGVGPGNLVEEEPHMGGEDFAFFAREAPGLFYFLGVSDFSRGMPAMVHTPFFAPDEGALEVGVRTSTGLLLDYLKE